MSFMDWLADQLDALAVRILHIAIRLRPPLDQDHHPDNADEAVFP